jgi:hypothetical protein
LIGTTLAGKTTLLRSGKMGKSSMSDGERESLIILGYNPQRPKAPGARLGLPG